MSRRIARQIALQLLYQVDLAPGPIDHSWQLLTDQASLQSADRQFAHSLITGVLDNKADIDQLIARFAKDWSIERMSCVDRNILRMAVYELKYHTDIPIKVSVNEAVELAKVFSDEQAARFINGILGAIVDYLGCEK